MKKENNTTIIIILLVLLLLFSFSWGAWGMGMGGMMFFGPIFMILVLVLIVWLIVSLTQNR